LGGTTENKNSPHQPTIKFRDFLPINFLPLPAPPYSTLKHLAKYYSALLPKGNISIGHWDLFGELVQETCAEKFDFLATRQMSCENWRGTTKNKNRPHQPTIKFTRFLPINFLPLSAPPYEFSGVHFHLKGHGRWPKKSE